MYEISWFYTICNETKVNLTITMFLLKFFIVSQLQLVKMNETLLTSSSKGRERIISQETQVSIGSQSERKR